MALRHLFILVVALAAVLVASAADTMTGVFDERIKSLQVRLDGNDFAAPVVVLGSSDRIRIDFDHLAEDRENFR